MASSLGQSFQDTICSAVLTAMCYFKAHRDVSQNSPRSTPIIQAEPVKYTKFYLFWKFWTKTNLKKKIWLNFNVNALLLRILWNNPIFKRVISCKVQIVVIMEVPLTFTLSLVQINFIELTKQKNRYIGFGSL